jgi:hypothetical protein
VRGLEADGVDSISLNIFLENQSSIEGRVVGGWFMISEIFMLFYECAVAKVLAFAQD